MAKGSEYQKISAAFAKAKAEQGGVLKQPNKSNSRTAASRQKEWEFKAAHIWTIGFFGLIIALHVLGIYLFTTGFLLTRFVLPHKSACDSPSTTPYGDYTGGSVEEGCWHPKTFNKAVVIIVDALRYDFTVPLEAQGQEKAKEHYHDALSVLYETSVQRPNNAFLLPFIADPPTATMQRLKGLTTGTLPTFIDVGSNFAGTAIDEDNLVAQLRDLGKTVVHLGDDTWHALFPGYFEPNLTKAYDSFNVWDLHTVDNGVNEHLFPLLSPVNSTKWDVVIGHYLGVDHAGHRYGPNHPAMAAKLQQMDDVFRRLITQIDDETLLVVMGDHGMDSKGDHGGESDDEVQAALWMYSKQDHFGRISNSSMLPPPHAKERPVGQIDLVPTLALLLGLPIPFNNLGSPIVEAFVGPTGRDFGNLAKVNSLTAAQIQRYQAEYAQAGDLDTSATAGPLEAWRSANDTWASLMTSSKRPTLKQWKDAADANFAYQQQALAMCRRLWAQFDIPSMIFGVISLAITLAVVGLYARGCTLDRTLVSSNPVRFLRNIGNPFPTSILGVVSALFPLLLSVGFASNSFTIWEDRILLFYLTSIGFLLFLKSLRQPTLFFRVRGATNASVFVLATRIAAMSRLCREEQMPYCISTYYASASSSTSASWQLIIPFAVALLLPFMIKSYYQDTRSYQSSGVFWIGLAFPAGLLSSALFWTLDAADDGGWWGGWGGPDRGGYLKQIRVVIAQVVLGIAFGAGYSTFVWAPPLVKVEAVKVEKSEDVASNNPSQPPEGQAKPAVAILGYANVHGSRYFILVTVWALAAILVSKPMGCGALALEVVSILALAETLDSCGLTPSPSTSSSKDSKSTTSAIGPTTIALIGLFHFFTTGHQAVLSSVQWESAFVPLHTVRYPWSPLMIALNSFAGPLIAAVAVPVVVLWKRPVARGGASAVGPNSSSIGQGGNMRKVLSDVAVAVATFLTVYALIGLATAMWAGHLRRHLMLYRIFSPRFMTAEVMLLFVEIVAVGVGLGGCWWSFGSVAEGWGW